MKLSQCEYITNCDLFLESHFAVIDANRGNKIALPYYNRILKFYKNIN